MPHSRSATWREKWAGAVMRKFRACLGRPFYFREQHGKSFTQKVRRSVIGIGKPFLTFVLKIEDFLTYYTSQVQPCLDIYHIFIAGPCNVYSDPDIFAYILANGFLKEDFLRVISLTTIQSRIKSFIVTIDFAFLSLCKKWSHLGWDDVSSSRSSSAGEEQESRFLLFVGVVKFGTA